MSKKATIKNTIELQFTDVEIQEQTNGLKFHVKELQGVDIHHLSFIMEKHPSIKGMLIKRSGTGLTVLINL
jgi:hypothetical protein